MDLAGRPTTVVKICAAPTLASCQWD
jgi:hypothetical protein